MQVLSLHTFDETYPEAEKLVSHPLLKIEALRRLAWAVFFLDTTLDAGRHGVHTVTEEGYHLQLPCGETDFAQGKRVRTAFLSHRHDLSTIAGPPTSVQRLGISAHLMRTAAMRRRIMHYNSTRRYSVEHVSASLKQVDLLGKDLQDVIAALPPNLMYSLATLALQAEQQTSFILLHTLRHNCFLMLARTRMNICGARQELTETLHTSMRERIRHAISVARIVGDAIQFGVNCDPFVAVQAYSALEGRRRMENFPSS